LEKKRRKIDKSELVFVGMANIADYYWCGAKAILRSRDNELMFFRVYLEDRIRYSIELNLIDKLPKKQEALLHIGDEITYNDIEKLLKKRCETFQEKSIDTEFYYLMSVRIGKAFINPFLPPEQKEVAKEIAKSERYQIVDDLPMERGNFYHLEDPEKYPTIRWNFNWGNYVIVGEPDGITDDFVYEYKTTNRSLHYIKPVAFAQADLYGYFFRRPKKRVKIFVIEENKPYIWEEKVDAKNALETLKKFKLADKEGWVIPPKNWKCKNCEYREKCKLKNKIRRE
jgi:CRISPR/Cas system-associated exonuclease Cas4 (RecB family)